MIALVGYTGFVGSNIYASGKKEITHVYNSQNITDAYGTEPDLLIYAGLRAEKYLANNMPEKDMELIIQAEENIRKIAPKKLVLISTIDVFKTPFNVDETTQIDTQDLHAYGYNRYQLELWVREHYPDALIIRLPGLFGSNIKKNFIYDYMNLIPFMLKSEKMEELSQKENSLKQYYSLQKNGFYRLNHITTGERNVLKKMFADLGFTALNFTDSRSKYQFYPLRRLWADIQTALQNDILLWHPATEPISAAEVYRYLSGETFENELDGRLANYDYKTLYSAYFGGSDGYISKKEDVLMEIKFFVKGARDDA